ncbi:MAG: hypothetical protein J6J64_03925 [Alistipes sp.]|nr:hypothetical protein [Alistipes sp.]
MKKIFTTICLAFVAAVMFMPAEASAQNSRYYIKDAIDEWGECRNVAITKYNGDIALYGRNGYSAQNIPDDLMDAIKELHERSEYIDDIQLTEDGNWLIIYGDNGLYYRGITKSLERAITDFHDDGETITSVTFNDDGDWIVISTEHIQASDSELQDWLGEGIEEYGQLWAACITEEAVVAVYEGGYKFWGDVPSSLKQALRESSLDVYRLKIAGSSWFFADSDGNYHYNM